MIFKNYKDYKNVSGIYQIRNLINGNVYVGSAINLCGRYRSHLSELKNNKHGNNHLQNAWNKYSNDNFIFEILELVPDKLKLIETEQVWIDSYPDHQKYNITPTAGSNLGIFVSEESRAKMALAKEIPVIQINKYGSMVGEFRSISEASEKTGVSLSGISKVILGKGIIAGDYMWVKKDDYSPNINYENVYLNYHERLRKQRKESSFKRSVYQICSVTGDIINKFKSVRAAEEHFNAVGKSSISMVCRGKINSCWGYFWMYCEDYDNAIENNQEIYIPPLSKVPVLQINPNTGYVIKEFDTVTNAMEQGYYVDRALNKLGFLAGGFMWIRKQDYDPNIDYAQEYIEYKKRYIENQAEKTRENVKRKSVIQISMETNQVIARYDSIKQASQLTGVNHGSICKSCKNYEKGWQAGGFYWQYAD